MSPGNIGAFLSNCRPPGCLCHQLRGLPFQGPLVLQEPQLADRDTICHHGLTPTRAQLRAIVLFACVYEQERTMADFIAFRGSGGVREPNTCYSARRKL